MEQIILYNHAKINLTLSILQKKADGYHDIASIMQPLTLSDTVICSKAEKTLLLVQGADLPLNNKNLAYQAWELMQREFALTGGIQIKLLKNIPVAAGLAGGSGNAAAVLKAINELFHLRLPLPQLVYYGKQLGADVPFCLYEQTALAEGIGEKITVLPTLPDFDVVLVNPGFAVSTKEVYETFDRYEQKPVLPQTQQMIRAIKEKDFVKIKQWIANMLEPVTLSLYPQLEMVKTDMARLGLLPFLCGSGPTFCGLAEDRRQAQQAVQILQGKYPLVLQSQFLSEGIKNGENKRKTYNN